MIKTSYHLDENGKEVKHKLGLSNPGLRISLNEDNTVRIERDFTSTDVTMSFKLAHKVSLIIDDWKDKLHEENHIKSLRKLVKANSPEVSDRGRELVANYKPWR